MENKVFGTLSKRRGNIVFKVFDESPLKPSYQTVIVRFCNRKERKDMLKQLINNNFHWKQYASVKCLKSETCTVQQVVCFTHATLPLSRRAVASLHPWLLLSVF